MADLKLLKGMIRQAREKHSTANPEQRETEKKHHVPDTQPRDGEASLSANWCPLPRPQAARSRPVFRQNSVITPTRSGTVPEHSHIEDIAMPFFQVLSPIVTQTETRFAYS